MHETPACFFNLESPSSDAGLPAGRHRLRGWLVSKPDRHFVDMRALVKGRRFAGVYGFPRADLAAHFEPGGRPWLPAEFTIDIDFTPGIVRVEIEALDFTGRWESVHTVTFTIENSPETTPPLADPASADDYGALAWLWLVTASERGNDAAREGAVAALPHPRMVRSDHLPFRGYISRPAAIAPAQYGLVNVVTWLFHETQRIQRVLATADLLLFHPLDRGGSFPGVKARYPNHPQADDCRFDGILAVSPALPPPVSVRIYAELDDGSVHLCLASHCRPLLTEELKAVGPALSTWSFWRGWRDLGRRLAARGIAHERDRLLWREFLNFRRHSRRIAGPEGPATAAVPTLAPATPVRGLSLLLVTHNLNREGAPLLFLEYAKHLARHEGVRLQVLAGAEGPLRADFEAVGAVVTVVDGTALMNAASKGELIRRLESMMPALDWRRIDLVVANTLACFWGVTLARRHGRRALWYIHESIPPHGFGAFSSTLLPTVSAAFREATAVSFNTPATRAYYEGLGTGANFHLNPAWIDRTAIDAFRTAHPRQDLRNALGLKGGDLLVVNIGTVCPRKGQHDFVRALVWLRQRRPELAARCRFVMVGGRDDPYRRLIDVDIASAGLDNLTIVPETSRAYDYFAAADLFVCSSYEESFPRVVLEAMAFGVPVVSTNVHGIPYMLRDGEEAVLVPPGDVAALTDGMLRLLSSPDEASAMATRARRRVTEFDAAVLLPHHAAFACRIATGSPGH